MTDQAPTFDFVTDFSKKFVNKFSMMLYAVNLLNDKTHKIVGATAMFREAGDFLRMILFVSPTIEWIHFAAITYIKAAEFLGQHEEQQYANVNKKLVKTFVKECNECMLFISPVLRKLTDPTMLANNEVQRALATIEARNNKPLCEPMNEKKQVSVLKLRGREIVRMI